MSNVQTPTSMAVVTLITRTHPEHVRKTLFNEYRDSHISANAKKKLNLKKKETRLVPPYHHTSTRGDLGKNKCVQVIMSLTGVIAYSYANRTGTRPLSEKGPAIMILGKFANTEELVAHINRVYPKGPMCTILQTTKNSFFPLLAPKSVMLKYPVQRANVHTKALMSLYQSRRMREKKEFEETRANKKIGAVNKESRQTQKRLEHLKRIGVDKEAPGNETKKTATESTEKSKPTHVKSPPSKTSNRYKNRNKKRPPALAPLDPRIKLCNQNFAVISVIHDERKSSKSDDTALEPIVSILDTFDTEKDAEKFAEKAYSQEVKEAPLYVVNMYAWLFTEDVTLANVKVRYPDSPFLEKAVREHQDLQNRGEKDFINKQNTSTESTQGKDMKLPAIQETPRISVAQDEKVPPPSTVQSTGSTKSIDTSEDLDTSENPTESNDTGAPTVRDLKSVMNRDDTTDIITNRILKRNQSQS